MVHRKRSLILAVALLAAAAGSVSAQTETEVALTRTQVEADRQAIVAENLGLTDAQAQVFWPLYREYTAKRAELGDRSARLLVAYVAGYKTMDDVTATKMLDEVFAIQQDEIALKKSWAGKMRKTLPGALVARFFQIDNKLDAYMKAIAADEIPLIVAGKPATITPGQ
jgi:hypothetical protein